ncbi:MAG TPA: acyl-CoA dehydrogenase family protein, partial [Acidimicrobiales bacterium]|nr:acyl-CoA dehydrogenase family protein [Acidimicrobiales bacterium]
AKVTLGNERVSLSGEGALWGRGPTAADLVELAKGRTLRPLQRDELVRVWSEGRVLSLLRDRLVAAALQGRAPGPEASVRKALADDHGQHVMGLAMDLAGTAGVLSGTGPFGAAGLAGAEWSHGFLYAQALTIGGGTAAVQRNIVAERVLDLPRDPSA